MDDALADERGGAGRRWRRRVALTLCATLVIAGGLLTMDAWTALGTRPSGDRLRRAQASSRYAGGKFVNALPVQMNMNLDGVLEWIRGGDSTTPAAPLPLVSRSTADFDAPPESGLRITWLGHSSMLIEIDGRRVLTDPVFSERASPSRFVGPKRFHPVPIETAALPALDAVLISHDHYDHLDYETIVQLREQVPRFLVPLGVGAHLEHWGVAPTRIVELDWWDEVEVEGLRLIATPARHFSGRGALDRDATLWASWSIVGPEHRVFFSGDTGMFPGFSEIGERLGPFDATMIECGAYNRRWADVHLGPEQALAAHQALRGRTMIPVHWGTFDLALHSWVEPAERLMVAAARAGVTIATPRPGESVDPMSPAPATRWWPEVPWQTAEQHPVVSSQLPGEPAAPEEAPQEATADEGAALSAE